MPVTETETIRFNPEFGPETQPSAYSGDDVHQSPQLSVGDAIDDRFVVLPNPFTIPNKRGVVRGIWLSDTSSAKVYLAQDKENGLNDTVVKLQKGANKEDQERQERERRLVENFTHPNLIPMVATGVHTYDDGRVNHYIATDFASGGDLSRKKVVDEESANFVINAIIDAAEVLAELHEKGLVHRDVKPRNILLDGKRAYLTDFGIVAVADELDETAPLIHTPLSDELSKIGATQKGNVVGTIDYMSPDRLEGKPARSDDDAYSLGASGFQELASRLPWDTQGKSLEQILRLKTTEKPEQARLPRYVHSHVAEVITALINEKSGDKPAMQEVKDLRPLVV